MPATSQKSQSLLSDSGDQVAAHDSPELAQMRLQADSASKLMRTMGSKNRLLILCILTEGELSVGQINDRINLAQSAVSQHLAVLRLDALVATRKQAQTVYYRLRSGAVEKIIRILHDEFCPDGQTGAGQA